MSNCETDATSESALRFCPHGLTKPTAPDAVTILLATGPARFRGLELLDAMVAEPDASSRNHRYREAYRKVPPHERLEWLSQWSEAVLLQDELVASVGSVLKELLAEISDGDLAEMKVTREAFGDAVRLEEVNDMQRRHLNWQAKREGYRKRIVKQWGTGWQATLGAVIPPEPSEMLMYRLAGLAETIGKRYAVSEVGDTMRKQIELRWSGKRTLNTVLLTPGDCMRLKQSFTEQAASQREEIPAGTQATSVVSSTPSLDEPPGRSLLPSVSHQHNVTPNQQDHPAVERGAGPSPSSAPATPPVGAPSTARLSTQLPREEPITSVASRPGSKRTMSYNATKATTSCGNKRKRGMNSGERQSRLSPQIQLGNVVLDPSACLTLNTAVTTLSRECVLKKAKMVHQDWKEGHEDLQLYQRDDVQWAMTTVKSLLGSGGDLVQTEGMYRKLRLLWSLLEIEDPNVAAAQHARERSASGLSDDNSDSNDDDHGDRQSDGDDNGGDGNDD